MRHPALYLLPNAITLASIGCGFLVLVLAGSDPASLRQGAALLVLSMVLDVVDGRVARLTGTQSAFGVQFDSLADVISFGVAPAVLLYRWSLSALGTLGVVGAFAYLAAGAIRLARFNVAASAPGPPGVYLQGLPIPGGAGIVAALVLADPLTDGLLSAQPSAVLAGVIATSVLMLSRLRFRAFKRFRVSATSVAFGATVISGGIALAVLAHPVFTLVWVLAVYVVLAFVESAWAARQRPDGHGCGSEGGASSSGHERP
ncbi:MAG: CDP-diacylglycerol--serine O-phosphatidyltransferase [Sandaracinaceae bacterium]